MTDRTVASEWDRGRDRYRGALLGLAVADALGTTVEFKPPGSFAPLTDIVGGGPFDLPAGAWTDDTSMALCLADSLLAAGGFDASDQLRRYVGWYRRGERSSTGRCFDIGGATRAALERFERTGDPYPGDASPTAGGNGVIMKLAPVPMAYAAHPDAAVALAADSARTTHGHPAALDAARYLAALLIDAIYGADRAAVAAGESRTAAALRAAGTLHPDVQAVADGTHLRRHPPDIAGDAYAPRTLEAALWALHTTGDYAAGALAVANLGGDADTTAAVYGQLSGAIHGADAIPERWRRITHLADEITSLADGLFELAQRVGPPPAATGVASGTRPARAETPHDGLPADAYWVRQDRIAAGPYPGAATPEEAKAKLAALLAAGVTTFVDLTEEHDRHRRLEPYSHLLRSVAARRGIRATHLRLPIDDTDVPPAWRMRVILDAIDTAVGAGEVAYIHCWGGVGRTGTVVGCLLREAGATPDTVLADLQELRAHTTRASRPSPENARQADYVTGWTPGRRV